MPLDKPARVVSFVSSIRFNRDSGQVEVKYREIVVIETSVDDYSTVRFGQETEWRGIPGELKFSACP